MKKFNFEAKIEGIITIKDDSMSNDDVLNDLKHALFCVVEDGNSPEYLEIGSNRKTVKITRRENDQTFTLLARLSLYNRNFHVLGIFYLSRLGIMV